MFESALLCLALNVFFESRGEPFAGQLSVAQVTMNRAGDDPAKLCKVVKAPKQFSWTSQKRKQPSGDAWDQAKHVAGLAIQNDLPDLTNGATHFHTKYVSPKWRHMLARTLTIGSHIFYKPKTSPAVKNPPTLSQYKAEIEALTTEDIHMEEPSVEINNLHLQEMQ